MKDSPQSFIVNKLYDINIVKSSILIAICFLFIISCIFVYSYAQSGGNVDETLLPKLFDRTKGAVVQITVSNNISDSGLGSGFVYDTHGHIITNDHVAHGPSHNDSSDEVTVTFLDGKSFKAKVVASDPFYDLAILKIENSRNETSIPLVLGNSSELRIGEHVVAIGNPFGLSGSMTEGIISGLGRVIPSQSPESPDILPDQDIIFMPRPLFSIPEIIQTDAAINPGNSGGPLLNLKGQVIGMNIAIFSATGENSGIGFAIPSNTIKRIVPVLISERSYKHPWIGISGMDVNQEIASAMNLNQTSGFLVIETSPSGPASKAGIQAGNKLIDIDGRETRLFGDVIIKIDNQNVSKIEDILVYLEQHKKVGEKANLTVIREGKLKNINIILEERPIKLDIERPWLGINGIDMNPDIASKLNINQSNGILVVGIISEGPADKAGIRGGYKMTEINGTQIELGGDIIVSADNQTIENLDDFTHYITNNKKSGDVLNIGILRDGEPEEIKVTLEAKPKTPKK